jgi:hypothetical protein
MLNFIFVCIHHSPSNLNPCHLLKWDATKETMLYLFVDSFCLKGIVSRDGCFVLKDCEITSIRLVCAQIFFKCFKYLNCELFTCFYEISYGIF